MCDELSPSHSGLHLECGCPNCVQNLDLHVVRWWDQVGSLVRIDDTGLLQLEFSRLFSEGFFHHLSNRSGRFKGDSLI
jgi:hypothetical protein